MDTESLQDNFDEERFFETGYKPIAGKFLFIDITLFMSLLQPCFEAVGNKLKRNKIDKLLASKEWHQHYIDNTTGKRVLSESGYIEHSHELKTAISLADKGYDILFAPKGMFHRTEKKFDIFIISNHIILKADLKCISSKNPGTIANRIKGGAEQASRVVIEIASDIEKKELIAGLRSGIYKNKLLKEIFLFYNKHFYILPKNLILSKRVYNILK